jgi:hypothetical protein
MISDPRKQRKLDDRAVDPMRTTEPYAGAMTRGRQPAELLCSIPASTEASQRPQRHLCASVSGI